MEQSYIFDFCTLFDTEQDKDIKSYIQQQMKQQITDYEGTGNIKSGANV